MLGRGSILPWTFWSQGFLELIKLYSLMLQRNVFALEVGHGGAPSDIAFDHHVCESGTDHLQGSIALLHRDLSQDKKSRLSSGLIKLRKTQEEVTNLEEDLQEKVRPALGYQAQNVKRVALLCAVL